jgi:cytochrome c oxidase subunit 2
MRTQVVVMPQRAFDAWLSRQSQRLAAPGGGGAEAGAAVFENNGCGSCHTFEPAGATGTIGPNLDNLQQAAEQAGQPLEEFVRQSIVEPNAVVAEGFQPNVMPPTVAELPEEQLNALVAFLTQGEGG